MRWGRQAMARRWAPLALVILGLLVQSIGPAAGSIRTAAALSPAGERAAAAAPAAARAQAPTGFWQFREVRTKKEYCADRATLGPGAVRPDECSFSLADGEIQGTIITTDVDNKKGMYGGVMTWNWAPEVSIDVLTPGERLGVGARIAEHPRSDRPMSGYFRWGSVEPGKDVLEGFDILGLETRGILGFKPADSAATTVPNGPFAGNGSLVLVASVYGVGWVWRIYDWVEAGAACRNWAGQWVTDWGELVLTQSGDSVNGVYSYRNGRLQGTISEEMGNIVLRGTWTQDNGAGEFEFTMTPDCRGFNGRWRYDSAGEWQSDWSGTRAGAAPPSGATPVPAPTATTRPAAATFTGPMRFGTNVANEQLVGEAGTFPAGTARVYVYFQRQNAPGGTPYSVRWLKDGQVTNSYDYTMPAGFSPDGATWFWLAPASGFTAGQWQVVLTLNGAEVLRGGFTVR